MTIISWTSSATENLLICNREFSLSLRNVDETPRCDQNTDDIAKPPLMRSAGDIRDQKRSIRNNMLSLQCNAVARSEWYTQDVEGEEDIRFVQEGSIV